MTWFAHATAGLTTGQLFWALTLTLTALAMATDITVRRIRARAATRRHPANRRPFDWARDDITLRQAVNVHRKAS